MKVKALAREIGAVMFVAVVLGFSYSAMYGKGFFGPDKTVSTSSTIAPAPEMIRVEEARLMFLSGDALFVDARHEVEFAYGHIKGAINIPVQELAEKGTALNAFPKNRLLVVYCDGVECNSSIELAARLASAGFVNVKIFHGGWQEWNAQQLPVEK
jgi:rhodanese-related sulfurtransferase